MQFYLKPASVEPFERSLTRLLEEARQAPGCRWAYAFKAEDITPGYLVLSGWEDGTSMRAWEESPRHVGISNLAEEEWFTQPLVMRQYQLFG